MVMVLIELISCLEARLEVVGTGHCFALFF